ncbi:MAG TPA: aminotransferase class V-fold PLP-dependent enzyme [Thermodesulfobacteriota bacterium]|nr:aminotransferase class V-fold PLP-dependent enzyme [Thermodesulfobacteriota bacterium]
MIYFDNAATSFPKPEEVARAMVHFSNEIGGSPGRSGHRLAIEAGRVVFEAREGIARLFGVKDSSRAVFGLNATEGINQGLKGLLRPGDHLITSSMEHNSVMRPLRAMMKEGLEVTILNCSPEGLLDPSDVKKAIRPNTRMVVLNHASNVVGTIQPLSEIGEVCRRQEVLFFVDAAQSAGAVPIDMEQEKIDLLAFTGHKALFGPQGTGGLVLGERVDEKELVPVKRGGTGSRSEQEEQPDFLPDLCESGTPNAVGLAGLLAGLEFVMKVGIGKIRHHEKRLTEKLLQGLLKIEGVTVYGPGTAEKQLATVSFNLKGILPSEVGLRLDEDFGILCRVGLHCAPAAHRTLKTFPEGTVRFGLSYLNREVEVEEALQAVARIARRGA